MMKKKEKSKTVNTLYILKIKIIPYLTVKDL